MTKKIHPQDSYATRSAKAVFLCTFFSLGLYQIYWAYRHWKEIGQLEDRKTHPVWATIFIVFTFYPLMKNLERIYHKKGVAFNTQTVTTVFYLTWIASFLVLRLPLGPLYALALIAILLLEAGVLAYVQKNINASLAKNAKAKRFSAPEIVWIVLGCVLFVPTLVGSAIPEEFYDSLNASPAAPLTLTSEQRVQASLLNAKAESLAAEYDACIAHAEHFASELPDGYTDEQWQESVQIYDECETIRLEQNKVAEEYNDLTADGTKL